MTHPNPQFSEHTDGVQGVRGTDRVIVTRRADVLLKPRYSGYVWWQRYRVADRPGAG
jgi:hypothetical protein